MIDIYFLLLLTQVDFLGATFYFLESTNFENYFYFLESIVLGNKPVQPFLFIALPQGMAGRVKGHMFLLGLYGNIAQL